MRCKLSPNDPDYDDSFDVWYDNMMDRFSSQALLGERLEMIERILEFPPYDEFDYDFPHESEKENWDWFYDTHPKDYSAFMAKLLESNWPYQSHVSEEIEDALMERWS